MKRILASLSIAFSTYSKIPVPQVEWSEKNMKYSICFFPVIGAVIGALQIALFYFCQSLEFNSLVFAGLATVLPMIISGGIHLDGFCDTVDALSSWQDKDKKLEILKDPNAGAFAVIRCCALYIVMFAMFTAVNEKTIYIIAFSYAISRCMSGISIMCFKSARANGTAKMMADGQKKKIVLIVLSIYLAVFAVILGLISTVLGAVLVASSLLVLLYYKWIAYNKFGGFTGDIAGYFVTMCELFALITVVFAERMVTLWF